jgi:hypothetical protein
MDGAKPSKSPCAMGAKLSKFDGDPFMDPFEYRHVISALQYCTLIRPEIAFSVNQLCQHRHAPTFTHWAATKLVLRYLKGIIEHGLFYAKWSLQLTKFCDFD